MDLQLFHIVTEIMSVHTTYTMFTPRTRNSSSGWVEIMIIIGTNAST